MQKLTQIELLSKLHSDCLSLGIEGLPSEVVPQALPPREARTWIDTLNSRIPITATQLRSIIDKMGGLGAVDPAEVTRLRSLTRKQAWEIQRANPPRTHRVATAAPTQQPDHIRLLNEQNHQREIENAERLAAEAEAHVRESVNAVDWFAAMEAEPDLSHLLDGIEL